VEEHAKMKTQKLLQSLLILVVIASGETLGAQTTAQKWSLSSEFDKLGDVTMLAAGNKVAIGFANYGLDQGPKRYDLNTPGSKAFMLYFSQLVNDFDIVDQPDWSKFRDFAISFMDDYFKKPENQNGFYDEAYLNALLSWKKFKG